MQKKKKKKKKKKHTKKTKNKKKNKKNKQKTNKQKTNKHKTKKQQQKKTKNKQTKETKQNNNNKKQQQKTCLRAYGQRRRRSNCASAQSDQGHLCPLTESLNHWILQNIWMENKGQMKLCARAGWCESAHFAHVRRQFSSWCDPFVCKSLSLRNDGIIFKFIISLKYSGVKSGTKWQEC